jgi:hypothetical protein
MKKTATAITLFACVAVVLAAERNDKACMFAPTNFGMLIPSPMTPPTAERHDNGRA